MLQALLPGRYVVRLMQHRAGGEDAELAAGPESVTVSAGAITAVQLTAP